MEGSSEIRISGIDEARPPRLRKEPYIDLFFRISKKAPEKWCDDFNGLAAEQKLPAKIDPAEGLVIATWVRKPEEIETMLDTLKKTVRSCNDKQTVRLEAEAIALAQKSVDPANKGAQGELNQIIARLNFDS